MHANMVDVMRNNTDASGLLPMVDGNTIDRKPSVVITLLN